MPSAPDGEEDASAGWDAIADRFMAVRSPAGADMVLRWSRCLPPGGTILDLGCGSGVPMATALAARGFVLFGVDASPRLLAAFRQNLPGALAACEPAERSSLFGRRFDGVLAIGLLFLLPETAQTELIARVGLALIDGGRFLFSAPHAPCAWRDTLTGRESRSLGEERYAALIAGAGMQVVATFLDEGGNHYFDAVALPRAAA
ncbi:class I SAM-dependent methyltransferase [Sphingomonas pituitosa]|uniref:class I SAM-dependent methyltransferase n=1 Tax=Sphingomonas pituitosa TaxID=99597 RepID=UPI000A5B0FD0|nr:class I SAM-dependent methyltransferase [Sphingomonas pituitosa]